MFEIQLYLVIRNIHYQKLISKININVATHHMQHNKLDLYNFGHLQFQNTVGKRSRQVPTIPKTKVFDSNKYRNSNEKKTFLMKKTAFTLKISSLAKVHIECVKCLTTQKKEYQKVAYLLLPFLMK